MKRRLSDIYTVHVSFKLLKTLILTRSILKIIEIDEICPFVDNYQNIFQINIFRNIILLRKTYFC